ncbi:MAG: cyclase family protein [Candidatus Coatesbacteria bacterium]|nr:cyclase family protein [Candidatus Coatesbacteria bacterium]
MKNSAEAPLIDISISLSARTVTYPGDPNVVIETIKGDDPGDVALVHKFCMGSHSGTHIDAPAHMIREGNALQKIDLNKLIGPCSVVDCTDCEQAIDADRIRKSKLPLRTRVLLRTRNSEIISGGEFRRDFVHLTPDGASFLAERGVCLVGIDYLSIGASGPAGVETHRQLLSRDIVILEGLDLSRALEGEYDLICLPLKLDVPDGAPVRAVLRRLDGISTGREEQDTHPDS